jgi:hypothetical protein
MLNISSLAFLRTEGVIAEIKNEREVFLIFIFKIQNKEGMIVRKSRKLLVV